MTNKVLILLIIFFTGIITGIISINALRWNSPSVDFKTEYDIMYNLRTSTQKSFLKFYKEEYCNKNTVNEIIILTAGTNFKGLYCKKRAILLLDDKLPITFIRDSINQ